MHWHLPAFTVIQLVAEQLIEAMTYRLAAHSSSDDPSGYRSKDEEDTWRLKDPILRMRKWLEQHEWWGEKEETEAQERLRREVLDSMKRAEKRPAPALDTLITDVYAEVTPALQRQFNALKSHIRCYPDAYPKGAQALELNGDSEQKNAGDQ